MSNFGVLYVVATPIGNLDDLSLRAKSVLSSVDRIAAEDTRHSKRLLAHYQINTPLFSLHAHNEYQRIDYVLNLLHQGHNIALITDAGTPLISDPGYPIVVACRKQNVCVKTIPGACAAIAALSISGIACHRFSFEGFLPAKSHARQIALAMLKNDERTLIFYVSKHRLLDDLTDMMSIFGAERKVALARELTKQFETVMTGKLSTILQQLHADPNQVRGEMVLVVEGFHKTDETNKNDQTELKRILGILLDECSVKQAVKIASKITGQKKNTVYALALALK